MNERLRQFSVAVTVSISGALMIVAPARASSARSMTVADPGTGNSCHGYFMGPPDSAVTITSDAGPTGSTINPGQTITVTVSWSSERPGKPEPSKVDNCVQVGSDVSDSLSQQVRPEITGASEQFSYSVPSQSGAQLCDRGAVEGAGNATGKSDILCYSIGPSAALPETTFPILLPIGGVVTAGALAFVLARFRRSVLRRGAQEKD
jgi:hypothetical protein